MKWRYKESSRPKEGQTRGRAAVAWLPTKCSDGMVRWLEKIYVVERYERTDWEYNIWGWVRISAHPKEGCHKES